MSKKIMNIDEFKHYGKNSNDERIKRISNLADVKASSLNYYLNHYNIEIEIVGQKEKK